MLIHVIFGLVGIVIGLILGGHPYFDTGTFKQFKLIHKKLDKMGKTQSEAAAQLNTIATQLGKVRTEVQKLVDAAANEDQISDELQTAIDNVQNAVQGVDDLNADVTEEPPVV